MPVLPRDHQGSRLARLAFCGLTLFFLLFAAVTGASRYDYDALGRLIRVIDEQGRVTEYVYDPAGNLLHETKGPGSNKFAQDRTQEFRVCPGFRLMRRAGTSPFYWSLAFRR